MHNFDLRKARERELATLDEKSTSSGIAEPDARYKIEGKNRGGEGTTPVTPSFVQKLESIRSVKNKKNTARVACDHGFSSEGAMLRSKRLYPIAYPKLGFIKE